MWLWISSLPLIHIQILVVCKTNFISQSFSLFFFFLIEKGGVKTEDGFEWFTKRFCDNLAILLLLVFPFSTSPNWTIFLLYVTKILHSMDGFEWWLQASFLESIFLYDLAEGVLLDFLLVPFSMISVYLTQIFQITFQYMKRRQQLEEKYSLRLQLFFWQIKNKNFHTQTISEITLSG